MKKKVTIKDIAKELGISPSSVARALKDHPEIGKETTKRVKDLAQRLRYTPNLAALNFRQQRSNMIGVIVPEIVHHFFSSIIDGAESVAKKHGCNLAIFQSKENMENEVFICQSLIRSRIDGVIISMAKNTTNDTHFKQLQDAGIPIVFFDRICGSMDTDRVIINDFEAAYIIVKHMIEIGCRRIAHLGAPQTLQIGQKRQLGYIKALKEAGIPIDYDIILQCDTREEGRICATKLMEMSERPDGIFAVNDLTASGAMTAIKQLGYRIPQDVAITGFTDGIVARNTDPTLTSIEQHGSLIGEMATELLMKRIVAKEDFPTHTEVIKTNLIIRESTDK